MGKEIITSPRGVGTLKEFFCVSLSQAKRLQAQLKGKEGVIVTVAMPSAGASDAPLRRGRVGEEHPLRPSRRVCVEEVGEED